MRSMRMLTRMCERVGQRWQLMHGAFRAGLGLQASPGIEPGPAWHGCGVSCCATKHNGRFGKVAAVTALKLRLVQLPRRAQPLRPSGLANPRYVLRPLPCACGLLLSKP